MIILNISKPIPSELFPNQNATYINSLEEPLVDLCLCSGPNIIFGHNYYFNKIEGTSPHCYAREEVAKKLIKISNQLPTGYKLKIFDIWRSFKTQYMLYKNFEEMFRQQNPDMDDEEVSLLTQKYVSRPIRETLNGPVHCSGGSVDLTIVSENGKEIDMGTSFDDFSVVAHTDYFEKNTCSIEVRNNRRWLYNLMISEGFTNLPTEWWHYDFGNKFWSFYKQQPAFYKSIFEISEGTVK